MDSSRILSRVFLLSLCSSVSLLNAGAARADIFDQVGGWLNSAAETIADGVSQATDSIQRQANSSQGSTNAGSAPGSSSASNSGSTPSSSLFSGFLNGGIQVSSNVTQDSSVLIETQPPQGVHWIMVLIEKSGAQGEAQKSAVAYAGGVFSQRVVLNQGPGDYKISIFTSMAELRGNSFYEYLSSVNVRNLDTRDLTFLAASAEVQSDDPEIQALAQSITQGTSSDREKSIRIHNWVAQNIAYDVASYFQPGGPANPPSDALSTLHSRRGFCEGYANLTAALHRAVGIRVKTIRGSASPIRTQSSPTGYALACSQVVTDPRTGAQVKQDLANHGWNEVLIDGQWLVMDTTWDSGYVDSYRRQFTSAPSNRFLFTDAATFAQSHLKCEEGKN